MVSLFQSSKDSKLSSGTTVIVRDLFYKVLAFSKYHIPSSSVLIFRNYSIL
jgi:DNA mismatch repair ATPase MutL